MPAIQLKMGRSCVSKASLAKLRELSLFVDDLVNRRHDPAAPFIGQQAFSHKAGAHVHAVQKAPETYEHIDPGVVGNERHILVSELSGGSNVLLKAIEMGVGRIESAEGMRDVLGALKALEAKGYTFEAADASFQILVQKVLKQHRSFFDLEGYRVIVEKGRKGTVCTSEATIKLRVGDQVEQTVAEGDGPVNGFWTQRSPRRQRRAC
jgi:2-isopropylmalate synthase